MNRAPVAKHSDIEWLLLTTPDDTEEAPWMTTPEFQWRVCALLMSILERHKRARGLRWYLVPELKITMPRAIISRDLDLGPDLMMAESDDHQRRSWNVTIEGGPPLFALEVVTEESWRRDTVEKPLLYERMGVLEYAIFAPYRTTPGPKLFGHRRNARGHWVKWTHDGPNTLRSEALGGLRLFADGDRLGVLDHDGNVLLSAEEAADAAEAELRELKARYSMTDT